MPELRTQAWARWQAAAGPWRGWAVCPALSMPGSADAPRNSGLSPPRAADLEDLESELARGGVAVVCDLDPTLGVRLAAELSHRRLAHVVLVLPRWPHADAVLATDELVQALVATSHTLATAVADTNVVFVLDAERQRTITRPAGDPRVDNRYVLSAGDLPSLARLREARIQRIVKLACAR